MGSCLVLALTQQTFTKLDLCQAINKSMARLANSALGKGLRKLLSVSMEAVTISDISCGYSLVLIYPLSSSGV
jgi:hypothetical protein